MSEYWKSTPKYWCKHCKAFIRDTKLERQNHDATPKHQGNLKRFIRDIHRGTERDEREQQRAKNEVARLNGLTGSSTAPIADSGRASKATPAPTLQATPEERKRQMAQLAALGVAVPEHYRREAAMAGDWQMVAERPIYDDGSVVKKEEGAEESKEWLNIGVRKRKVEEEEDGEADVGAKRKPVWGSSLRAYPGMNRDEGLEKLLGTGVKVKSKAAVEDMAATAGESTAESLGEGVTDVQRSPALAGENETKPEDDAADLGFLFKKRKPKALKS